MFGRTRTVIFTALALCAGPSFKAVAQQVPKSDWGGAVPLSKSIMRDGEYPTGALLREEQGVVGVSFVIGTDGRISSCEVTQPTGYKELDELPCKLLTKRARFRPALDEGGNPIATRGTTYMRFSVPR